MKIGVPKEVKDDEYRTALLPVGAQLLVEDGHEVFVQRDAGRGSGFENEAYVAVGAILLDDAGAVYETADLIVKVKEPQPDEMRLLREGQIVFCYFHFAASAQLTRGCCDAGIAAVAYETLRDAEGRLPLLTPMSEIAGKMSVQEGAKYLERPMMGRGILLGGVPGVERARVLVLGAGVVGTHATRVAAGLGANVTVMDIDIHRLRHLDEFMPGNVTTVYCDPHAVEEHIARSDLVIGAVLVPGGRAPRLVRRKMLAEMMNGAVIVDVCIDQGGSVETSRPTTHHDPIYIVDGVVHYCVANMPGAVGRTSTQALCNATLPYVRELAGLGLDGFLAQSAGHAGALNLRDGRVLNRAVADALS
jgi:alanine dehydrogenase